MSGIITLAFSIDDLPPAVQIGIPLVGVLLITMSMMMGIRKKRRYAQQQGTAREQVDDMKQRHKLRGDLEQLMIEVEQLAKRFGAQLDAKTMHMEQLISEADRKIAELKQMELGRQNAAKLHEAMASPFEDKPAAPAAVPTTEAESASPTQNAGDALKQSVYDLAEKGHDPAEIAKQLNEHVGKIELILALRKS